jgi:hypothetical protein
MKSLPGFRFNTRYMYRGNVVMEYFLRAHKRFNALHSGFFTD